MMTVYKNRIVNAPSESHDLVFYKDFGASRVYSELNEVRVDIVPKGRLKPFVQLAAVEQHYSEIRITSLPDIANSVETRGSSKLIYEFHSSDETVLARELDSLNISNLDEIRVPSEFLAGLVHSLISGDASEIVRVYPNLVDNSIFSAEGPSGSWGLPAGQRPLVWVGRFDKGKNYRDFVRALSLLGPEFVGVVVVSMEDSPDRMATFLADASAYKVQNRVHLLMNLSPDEIASLYRHASNAQGCFVSTSLGESFGYGVAESMASGLPAVAYSVGALEERAADEGHLILVPVGDIHALASAISASSISMAR
ncbi:glycosyltransferase family 4 protein [Pseudarthrobacter sp. J47]